MTESPNIPRDPAADLAICEAATKGPWDLSKASLFTCSNVVFLQFDGDNQEECVVNASLVMMAREALPYWISRCLESEAKLAQIEAMNSSKVVK